MLTLKIACLRRSYHLRSCSPRHSGQCLSPRHFSRSGIPRRDFHIGMAQAVARCFQAVARQPQVVGVSVAQGVGAHRLYNPRFPGNSPCPSMGGLPGHIEQGKSPPPSAPATPGPGLRTLPHSWTCPPCLSRKDTTSHRPGKQCLCHFILSWVVSKAWDSLAVLRGLQLSSTILPVRMKGHCIL